jgi:hypothetical protein
MQHRLIFSMSLYLTKHFGDKTKHGQEVRAPLNNRYAKVGGWLLIVLMSAYFAGHTFPASWKSLNTDFPNYYLTARLARDQSNTSRIYEWIWLQRQKDHRQIEQRIVGLVAITPFSSLAVWPFAAFSPLTAKHYWLLVNLALVVCIAVVLRWITRQPWRRILLVIALSVPLNKNFLFGQYYVLLLFILTLACWCYVRQKRVLSGVLIGIGFGLKIFPLLYLAYFLRKRDFKAFVGGAIGSLCSAILSIVVFGWRANYVQFTQVLPWALRGEGLNPYDISSGSITTLLHRLFVYEPQWNTHPSIHAAWVFAVLLPLVQTLLFAPAILLAKPKNNNSRQLQLEWSAILLASLAISSAPASYQFTLLILPVCLIWREVQERIGTIGIVCLLLLYSAIGYPGWKAVGAASSLTLLSVPRLYAVILLCCFVYWLLATRGHDAGKDRETWLWAGAFVALLLLNIESGVHHQNGLYADYQWRLPTADSALQANGPVVQNDSILFTAMLPTGFHSATQNGADIYFDPGHVDQLTLAANSSERWTEETDRESIIISNVLGREVIPQAESPVASPDGRWLAYLREDHGRATLWLRALGQPASKDKVLTTADLDVLEMSFLPNGSLIFSAELGGQHPRLFLVDQTGTISSLGPDESRYPAISPNGRWFAYSKQQNGNWHLWLRDLHSGQTSRLTQADCNNVEPTWASDSKTLVYGSDCGRALRFTALCRRHIVE